MNPGDKISASQYNAMVREVERLSRLRAASPLEIVDSAAGRDIRLNRKGFWAQLTGTDYVPCPSSSSSGSGSGSGGGGGGGFCCVFPEDGSDAPTTFTMTITTGPYAGSYTLTERHDPGTYWYLEIPTLPPDELCPVAYQGDHIRFFWFCCCTQIGCNGPCDGSAMYLEWCCYKGGDFPSQTCEWLHTPYSWTCDPLHFNYFLDTIGGDCCIDEGFYVTITP